MMRYISFSMKIVQDDGKSGDSGVAGGQVEATKYVEFRNVAASFFTRNVGDFHGYTMFLGIYPHCQRRCRV